MDEISGANPVIKPTNYITESYAVRRHWVDKILRQFDINHACVRDCFATIHNRRFEKFYCAEQDALSLSWDINEVRWCNPPWSLWPRVADKILTTAGTSIAVFPAWHSQSWVQNLLRAAVKTIYFEVGSKVFELGDKKPVGGIRWGLYIVLVVNDIQSVQCEVFQCATWSASSRRRYRRQLQRRAQAGL